MAAEEMRLVVTVDDWPQAVEFFRDKLGLAEVARWQNDGGHGILLEAGRATLEIFDEAQARAIDEIEVGRRVAGQLRLAFKVRDSEASSRDLTTAGAQVIGGPVLTPWGDTNVRLTGPAGLQITCSRHLAMPADRLRAAVLGPGGVGGLLAALLARQGDDVVVLASETTSAPIDAAGIRLESGLFGDFVARVRTARRLDERVDVVFVTVKSTHLPDATGRVPAAELGDAIVIPFLNGFEHVPFLRSIYPADSVVAGTIRIQSDKPAPGLIRHTSPFAGLDLAPAPANRKRVERIASALTATGLTVALRDSELAMLWEKFAALGPLALLTTHERASIGPARERRGAELTALVDEVVATARAEGVSIDGARVVRYLESAPADLGSSMQRDQAAGRPTEIDALGGAFLRRAAAAGIDTPVASRLVSDLTERDAERAREPA